MTAITIRLRDPALTIPCPVRRRNIADGDVVDTDHPYWARILAEGDIIRADQPAPAKPTKE